MKTKQRKFRIEIEQENLPIGTESNSIDYQGNVWFTDKHGKSIAFLKDTVESHPHIFREITDNHDEEFEKIWVAESEDIYAMDGRSLRYERAKKMFNYALTLSKERECSRTKIAGESWKYITGCGMELDFVILSPKFGKYCSYCGGKIVEEEKKEAALPLAQELYEITAQQQKRIKREQAIGELIEYVEQHEKWSQHADRSLNAWERKLIKLVAAVKEGGRK